MVEGARERRVVAVEDAQDLAARRPRAPRRRSGRGSGRAAPRRRAASDRPVAADPREQRRPRAGRRASEERGEDLDRLAARGPGARGRRRAPAPPRHRRAARASRSRAAASAAGQSPDSRRTAISACRRNRARRAPTRPGAPQERGRRVVAPGPLRWSQRRRPGRPRAGPGRRRGSGRRGPRPSRTSSGARAAPRARRRSARRAAAWLSASVEWAGSSAAATSVGERLDAGRGEGFVDRDGTIRDCRPRPGGSEACGAGLAGCSRLRCTAAAATSTTRPMAGRSRLRREGGGGARRPGGRARGPRALASTTPQRGHSGVEIAVAPQRGTVH